MQRQCGRKKGVAPLPHALHLALAPLPAWVLLALAPRLPVRVGGQAPLGQPLAALAALRALPRLGLALVLQRVPPLARVLPGQRVPWQQVPPLAGARLAWVLARQSPDQGRALRVRQCRAGPGLAPRRVSSQPRPVRSWIGHG